MRLSFPFTIPAFIEACTFQSGPRHNRSAYAPRHHGEGASNRREYHPNQPPGEGREISFLEIREHRPPIRVFTPPSRGYYVTARSLDGGERERVVEEVKREKEERKEIPSL